MNEDKPKDEVVIDTSQDISKDVDSNLLPEEQEDRHEDDVLALAANDLSKSKDFDSKPKKPKKKRRKLAILILLLLIAAGGAVWFFLINKKTYTPEPTNQANEQEARAVNNGTTPDRVVYAYRESDTTPFSIYYRPAISGDRVEVTKLNKDEYISHFDVRKNVVAYATDKGIFVSIDSGGKFQKILEVKEPPAGELGEQLTSLKISTEATKVVFGLLPKPGDKNSVSSIDLAGDGKMELFKSEQSGIFIDGYSEKSNKIVYSEGCYNCDGNLLAPIIRDLKTNKTSKLSENIAPGTVLDIDVINDLSEVVVSHGTVDNSVGEGIGINVVAPYSITKIITDSGESSVVKTIGQVGEKNPNGTLKTRNVLAGFVAGTNDVYYSDNNEIFIIKGTVSPAIFGAASNILYAPFVSEAYVVSGFGSGTDNFELSYYDVVKKQSAQILLGDNNTLILGVTTK